MNGEQKQCERCGYILGPYDTTPRFRVTKLKVFNNEPSESEIVLCRFCNHNLDEFLRGFPIWATSEYKEVNDRYNGKIVEQKQIENDKEMMRRVYQEGEPTE